MTQNSRIPLKTPVSIDYLDSKCSLTHRTIYPFERYMRQGVEYIRAFCSLRGEERTFRADRIRSWRQEEDPGLSDQTPGADIHDSVSGSSRPYRGRRDMVSESVVSVSEKKKTTEFSTWSIILVSCLILAFAGGKPNVPASKTVPSPAKTIVVTPDPVTPSVHVQDTPESAENDISAHSAPSVPECAECGERFRLATHIDNPTLEAIYAAADYNRDGKLSWHEIQLFQNWMQGRFVYRSNAAALSPDRFLEEGGGDCEDWALFTCGMLRYWGWEAYLGTAGPRHRRRNSSGHAFTFIKTDEVPQGFEWFELTNSSWGFYAPAGKYVPVDYNVIGGYSSAVRRKWVIDGISSPESSYGKLM